MPVRLARVEDELVIAKLYGAAFAEEDVSVLAVYLYHKEFPRDVKLFW